jgi:replicative DNA helicase
MKNINEFFGKHNIYFGNIAGVPKMIGVLNYIKENKLDMNNPKHIKEINMKIMLESKGIEVLDSSKIMSFISIKDDKEKQNLNNFINSFDIILKGEHLMYRGKTAYRQRKDNIIKEWLENNQKLKRISPELSIKIVFISEENKERYITKEIFDLLERGLKESGFIKSFVEDFAIMYYSYIKENRARIEKCHKIYLERSEPRDL